MPASKRRAGDVETTSSLYVGRCGCFTSYISRQDNLKANEEREDAEEARGQRVLRFSECHTRLKDTIRKTCCFCKS